MRITRDALMKAARDYVNQQAHANRDIVAVYVVGSILSEEPLLGGTTDIDLIFVLNHLPSQPREVIRLTNEITLDIAYYDELDYKQPRHLRLNPWVGSSLCDTRIVLYDTNHWFEFTQSSVSSQFYDPENILTRSRLQYEKARSLWMGMSSISAFHPQNVLSYLKSIESAANSIASLSGPPLTIRRFLLKYPERTEEIDLPGLSAGLSGLLGADHFEPDLIRSWLPEWHTAMEELQGLSKPPVCLNSIRIPYYERAIEILLTSDVPQSSIWPLILTWTMICSRVDADSPLLNPWMKACNKIQLDPQYLPEKLLALDAYLDTIEEELEKWGNENGV
jgi:hypothetical protein